MEWNQEVVNRSWKKQNSILFRKLAKICIRLMILLVFLTLVQVVILNYFAPPFTVIMRAKRIFAEMHRMPLL